MTAKNLRHVLGLSGGKDSSALAIYMRDRVPEMEYFFTDTGAELPETYEYLDRLEGFLGKPIARLSSERNFDHLLALKNNFLPSPNTRWCTRELKIEPFERWIGDDPALTYIGEGAYIGHHCIVGGGSKISARAIVDDYCQLESRVEIGEKTLWLQ